MKSNKQLVESLISKGVLHSDLIIEAFLKIDRKDFVTEDNKDVAYVDTALPIGYEQTISQPYTVAFMLELLQLRKGQDVLDIGSGSGWTTALLSQIVGNEGLVQGLEIVEELVEVGRSNLSKYNIENATISKAKKNLGIPSKTFDRILVSASADKFPKELLDQLKKGGIMVIPVRNSIFKFTKDSEGEIEKEEYFGFSFVELK